MYPYKEKLRKLIDHRDPRKKKIKEGSFLDKSEIVPEGNLVEESFFFFFLTNLGSPLLPQKPALIRSGWSLKV